MISKKIRELRCTHSACLWGRECLVSLTLPPNRKRIGLQALRRSRRHGTAHKQRRPAQQCPTRQAAQSRRVQTALQPAVRQPVAPGSRRPSPGPQARQRTSGAGCGKPQIALGRHELRQPQLPTSTGAGPCHGTGYRKRQHVQRIAQPQQGQASCRHAQQDIRCGQSIRFAAFRPGYPGAQKTAHAPSRILRLSPPSSGGGCGTGRQFVVKGWRQDFGNQPHAAPSEDMLSRRTVSRRRSRQARAAA